MSITLLDAASSASSASLLGRGVTGYLERHGRRRGGLPSPSSHRLLHAMRRVRTVGQVGVEVEGWGCCAAGVERASGGGGGVGRRGTG